MTGKRKRAKAKAPAPETCGQCGEPMVTRPGDLEPTCGRCGNLPDACDCPKAGGADAPRDRAKASDKNHDEQGRPYVGAYGVNPLDVAKDAAGHILGANDPPRLFAMGQAAVRWQGGTLTALDDGGWLLEACSRVTFLGAVRKDGTASPAAPPAAVMKLLPQLVTPELPPLDGIATTPYLAEDGELVHADGYHRGTRRILAAGGLVLPPVPDEPDAKEVEAAVELLTGEWLGDFPFAGQADTAHMVAFLLTLTGRMLFPLAPLFVLDASTSGSGKNLLATTASLIATGEAVTVMELPADGEEQRKKVTTALMHGQQLIMWDESHVIAGRTLAAILTAEKYSDRILGGNKMMTADNRFTMLAVGNNVQVRGDLKRRVWPARLVPDTDHPELRDDFTYTDLPGWVREHRGDLLAAALVIWRNWIAAGRKRADITVGSFERWARTVGGALDAAGVGGFGGNLAEWLSHSEDDRDGEWAGYLAALHRRFADRRFTASDVAAETAAAYLPALPSYDPNSKNSVAVQVGYAFRTHLRDKWLGGLRLTASAKQDSRNGARTWTIRERDAAQNGQNIASIASIASNPPLTSDDSTGDGLFAGTGDASIASSGTGDAGHRQSPEHPIASAITAAQTPNTGDTGDTGDHPALPVEDPPWLPGDP